MKMQLFFSILFFNTKNGCKYKIYHLDGINYYKGVLLCSRPN